MSVSLSPAPTATATTSSLVCPRCVRVKKSGRRTCCARGGAWFRNCGAGGDTRFDHTWAEGLQACSGLFSGKTQPEPMLRHEQTQSQLNDFKQQIFDSANGRISSPATIANSRGFYSLTKINILITFLWTASIVLWVLHVVRVFICNPGAKPRWYGQTFDEPNYYLC